MRAKDIEIKRMDLKNKILPAAIVSLQDEKTTSLEIVQSLEPVLNDLKFEAKVNQRLKHSLALAVNGKLRGKWNDLKNSDHLATTAIIAKIQNEIFDMILENDKSFKLYEMR